jgi:hypothetical protein
VETQTPTITHETNFKHNNSLSELTMGTAVFSNERQPIGDTKINRIIHMDLAATVTKRECPITHSHNQGIYSALITGKIMKNEQSLYIT